MCAILIYKVDWLCPECLAIHVNLMKGPELNRFSCWAIDNNVKGWNVIDNVEHFQLSLDQAECVLGLGVVISEHQQADLMAKFTGLKKV